MKKYFLFIIALLFSFAAFAQTDQPLSITVDVAEKQQPLHPLWAFFGYDEPNYTYMKDGKKLLTEITAFSKQPVYVRAHSLLVSGDGEAALKWGSTNAYTEDKDGNPIYNWRIVDSIFDTYVQRGMKPIAEIGFMPEALSIHPQPYRHHWKPGMNYDSVFTGWAYPPKDYKKWAALVYEWVKHSVQRYGVNEVNTWYWEVWNEPNIGYWKGTPEEYYMLYDYTADAVKRACPNTRIGGPTSTGPGWDKAEVYLRNFLNHCATGVNAATGKVGVPLDYVSFHAKGSPKSVDGHVRMNMASQLTDIIKGCNVVKNSAFKNLPVILGECDPEGCAACGMATNPENAYRNGTMYSSYTAASFARIYDIEKQTGVRIEGAVSWSFEFEDQPWFYGFRDLATNGIDKPVLNVFRMYAMMKGNRLGITNTGAVVYDSITKHSVRGSKRDLGSLASADDSSTAVMLWNYHDDDLPAPSKNIKLTVQHVPAKKVTVKLCKIDGEYSNSYEVWKKMGSPQQVNDTQYKELEAAGQLHEEIIAKHSTITGGLFNIDIALPAQGVYLLRLLYEK